MFLGARSYLPHVAQVHMDVVAESIASVFEEREKVKGCR